MTAARIRAQFPTSDGFGYQLKGCCRPPFVWASYNISRYIGRHSSRENNVPYCSHYSSSNTVPIIQFHVIYICRHSSIHVPVRCSSRSNEFLRLARSSDFGLVFLRSRYACMYVSVLCFPPIHSGHQVRWTYQPGSHRRKVTQDFSSTFLLLRCVP